MVTTEANTSSQNIESQRIANLCMFKTGHTYTITNKYSMSKIISHWTVAFLTAVVMLLVHYGDSTIVQTLRLKQFDIVQTLDQPSVSQDIVVVAIDETAIEKYGQWPWKRDKLADIIWKLREAGAGIIVLPILMSETDRLGGDIELAQALVDNGVVIVQTGTTPIQRGPARNSEDRIPLTIYV